MLPDEGCSPGKPFELDTTSDSFSGRWASSGVTFMSPKVGLVQYTRRHTGRARHHKCQHASEPIDDFSSIDNFFKKDSRRPRAKDTDSDGPAFASAALNT